MSKYLLLLSAIIFFRSGLCAQTILGVDVSHYDGAITWTQVKSPGDKVFAFCKATEGTDYIDPTYTTNVTQGTSAGVYIGAYHFAHPELNTAAAEASYFLAEAGSYIGPGYLVPALDLEDPPTGDGEEALETYYANDPGTLTTWVVDWCSAVKNATGVAPVIYTDQSIAGFLGSGVTAYGLWVANPDCDPNCQPGTGVWSTWEFQQYSWTGTVSGIPGSSGEVDLDVFNGDATAFNTLIGIGVTPAFTASLQSVCTGNSVTYTDHSTSTGTITGYRWTFSGGSPDTSTSQNPVITYNTAGTYSVKEVVISTAGTDSITKSSYIHVIPGSNLPLVETFQSATFPPTGWTMNYPEPGDSAWELCTDNGYNSTQCMYFPANCGYTTSIAGERQQIYTPDYSFAGTASPYLWFDVAYEPYNATYSDTLAVYYSLDCGNTWTLIYLKGGMTLCTTGSTDSAGVDTSGGMGCFAPPNSHAWRTDSINLSSLTGDASVMFSFESRSGWGNIIYIDNINIASTAVVCTPPATPTIQASPGTTNCGPIQLTASSSGCTTCTYNWSNNSTGSTTNVSSSGTYTVTALNGSCSSSATSIAVTINQPPTVSASASSSPVCAGQPVTLTATGNAASYQWSGTGLQTTTSSSVSAIVSTAGSQTYTVTATLNGCTATATTSVTFNPTVVPTISISQVTGNPVCTGSQVSFSATITNGGNNPVYQWTSGSQTGSGITFTLNNASNGATVKCLLISNASCASPDSVASNILTLTTQSPQAVTLSISTPDTNVCSGENVAFTSSETNGGGSPVYDWFVNGGQVSTGSGYTLSNIQSNASVYCIMTSSASCVTGSPVTSNTVNVHIQTSAQASLVIAASADTICAGAPVTFTATAGNGGSSPAYTWQLNGNTVGSNSPVYTNSNLLNGDAVSCSMASSASCVTNPDVTSNTVIIQVNPLPVADAGNTVTIVGTSSATLGGNPTGAGGTPPYYYVWSPPTGLSSDTAANPIVSGISANTLYDVTVTDFKGCSATDSVAVVIGSCNLQAPTLTLNYCDFTAQLVPAVNYQWYFQSNILSGATSRFCSVTQTGSYFVQITDTVGCTAQSLSVYVSYPACLPSAIEDVSALLQFELFPNPTGGEVTLQFSNSNSAGMHIEVENLLGQSVYTQDLYLGASLKYTLSTRAFANGTYLLRVTDAQGASAVKRLIKM